MRLSLLSPKHRVHSCARSISHLHASWAAHTPTSFSHGHHTDVSRIVTDVNMFNVKCMMEDRGCNCPTRVPGKHRNERERSNPPRTVVMTLSTRHIAYTAIRTTTTQSNHKHIHSCVRLIWQIQAIHFTRESFILGVGAGCTQTKYEFAAPPPLTITTSANQLRLMDNARCCASTLGSV
jgi:hypothetical protein